MDNLKYGQRLGGRFNEKDKRHEMRSAYLQQQVRLWVSYRFQPMGRSTRGIMRYRMMYKWLAQINFPDNEAAAAIVEEMFGDDLDEGRESEDIDRLVDEKFEFIAGHQPYGDWINKPKGSVEKLAVDDMNYMLRKNSNGMSLAYLHNVSDDLSKIHGVNADGDQYSDKYRFSFKVKEFVASLVNATDDEKKEIEGALLNNKMPKLEKNRDLREKVKGELKKWNDQLYIDNFAGATAVYREGNTSKVGEDILTMIRDEEGLVIGRIIRTNVIELYSHYFAGQGKPVNQNNLSHFVTGDIMQLMDINQDMYLEETFKAPNLQEHFRDENVFIVGFPEDIFTERYLRKAPRKYLK
jgi:hypothetical protein